MLFIIDEPVKSTNFLFYVISAKAGRLVKRELYPVFSADSGLPLSRE